MPLAESSPLRDASLCYLGENHAEKIYPRLTCARRGLLLDKSA